MSLVIYNVGARATNWKQLQEIGIWGALSEPLKRSWFQTLMHIAVTSLWILPVVHGRAWVRIVWMVGSGLLHVVLSYAFNYVWVNTNPNGIDGGPLGFLTWTIPAIVGTLVCDAIVVREPRRGQFAKMLVGALVLMLAGYVLSCGTRLYDVPTDQQEARRSEKLASDPVWPTKERIDAKRSDGSSWLAEAPFVKPPDAVSRKWNYWMMSQRGGTLSYLVFSAGFSVLVFVVFYGICDGIGFQLAVFRTFGTNALLAYVLHSMVSSAVQPFFPKDSPWWYALMGLFLFFFVTWIFVRHFEKQGVYLRA